MDWKNTVTTVSEKIFPGISHHSQTQPVNVYFSGNEVLANLPLQMALYFNVIFYPIWCSVLIYFLVQKYDSFSELMKFIAVTVLTAVILLEMSRLFMGYEGNLKDKVPELAGFWMLSFMLQFPLQSFFLLNPAFNLQIVEKVCQIIVFVMLVLQIGFGYVALKNTARKQAIYFKIMKLGTEASRRR